MKYILLLTLMPAMALSSVHRKYTIEQLKALKPKVHHEVPNLVPKSLCQKELVSFKFKRKRLVHFTRVPHNSPEITSKKPILPVEEIVIIFEEFKLENK